MGECRVVRLDYRVRIIGVVLLLISRNSLSVLNGNIIDLYSHDSVNLGLHDSRRSIA